MSRNHILSLIAVLLLTPLDAPHAAASSAASDQSKLVRPAVAAAESLASQPKRERFPAFTWERVPRYIHIRKDTAFIADEIRYLASFPLITFEKTTGAAEFGSTERGTLAAAKAVKAINPAAKILYYRNVIVHYERYEANASLAAIPGAFLVDSQGRGKLVRNQVQAYDLTNERLREWWIANARQVCADPVIDGLFLDGAVKVLEPEYLRAEIGEEKKAAVVEGYDAMMTETRRILGPGKLMVVNLLRARFPDSGLGRLPAFDGSYIEGFENAVGNVPVKDYVAKGIDAVQKAARQGFLIVFTGGLGMEVKDQTKNHQLTDEIRKSLTDNEAVQQRFSYLLAIFLVCAEQHSYFNAHDSYDATKSKVWMTRPSEFDRPLGAPKGPAARSGYVYTREFAHASVLLDIEKQTGSITWKAQ